MINPTLDVSLRYGAPMGRRSDDLSALIIEPHDPRMYLRHIPFVDGDYDAGGAYWGGGEPLYWWSIAITAGDSTDECSGFIRARNRAAAKAKITALQPHARFYR